MLDLIAKLAAFFVELAAKKTEDQPKPQRVEDLLPEESATGRELRKLEKSDD